MLLDELRDRARLTFDLWPSTFDSEGFPCIAHHVISVCTNLERAAVYAISDMMTPVWPHWQFQFKYNNKRVKPCSRLSTAREPCRCNISWRRGKILSGRITSGEIFFRFTLIQKTLPWGLYPRRFCLGDYAQEGFCPSRGFNWISHVFSA